MKGERLEVMENIHFLRMLSCCCCGESALSSSLRRVSTFALLSDWDHHHEMAASERGGKVGRMEDEWGAERVYSRLERVRRVSRDVRFGGE
jgi:hypothetical protein